MASDLLLAAALAGAMLQSAAMGARKVTDEQAMAAHRAATSIGPDPCRSIPDDDEIVVCGRLTNAYEVPLYRNEGERYDRRGTTIAGALAVKDASAPCHTRGEPCLKPLPIVSIGPGGKVRIGED